MKSNWTTTTIDDVCSLVTDGAHNSPKSVEKGYYMASVKDFTEYGFDFSNCRQISEEDYEKLRKQGCVPKKDDVLVGKDGARYFEDIIIYRQDEQPALLSSIAILRANRKKITPEFLYYTLKTPAIKKDVRDNYGSGSAIPRVVLKDFKRMPFSYPDIDEQRKITAVCSVIDAKIQVNNAINKNLLEQVLTLYRNKFVDTANNERTICRADEHFDISIGKTPPRKEPQWFSTNPQDVTWVSIGFTGTPISAKDRNTREVFGDYIDVYDMTQAVEDGATRPVYYESRVVHLKLDENTLALIDSTYDVLEQQSDAQTIEKSKKMLGQMESVLGADSTIESLCDDIVEHYEKYRANLLTGKAMIVAYSRPIAMKIYRRILKIRPEWTDKVGVVMTGGNNDPEDWKEIIGTKSHKEELARKFKDNNDPMKIAIVVDMWLTGFDVPSLATMYVYKPMHGYNLMQAIARVNRVFKDKEGGLIVDYVGIASALKVAMKEYTKRDQSKYGDMNIAKMAYPKFQEKLQVCKDLLHGFDFSGFVGGSPLTMAKLISGGVNFILNASVPERKDLFLKEAMLLKQSHSLCSSMTTEQERHEAAYMEALRSTVIKITYGGTGGKSLSLTEINDQINELLKAAVQSEGVISLFDSSKSGGENFSLFEPAVLDEISRMKEKNIAVEILKKLMAEQVALYKRTNVVQSQKFSEKIAQLMNSYYNGLITNEEVIKELLKTAEEIANLYKNGQELGFSQEELAFYDALTKPEHIKDFYKNDELIALTRDLTEMLRKNRTIDWQKKETARAQMRKMVKRLLKKYKYPPEDYDFAISTVISQCELWTDNVEPRKEEKLYKYVSEIELSKVAEDTVSYGEKK